jgi:hypothetical protein
VGGRGTGLATKETYGFLLLRLAKDVSELGCTHDTEAHFGIGDRDNIVHKLTTKAEFILWNVLNVEISMCCAGNEACLSLPSYVE